MNWFLKALLAAFSKPTDTPPVAPKQPLPAPQPSQATLSPIPALEAQIAANYVDTLTSDWTTRKGIYHNVRVLCDLEGLDLNEKNTLCACIYQESEFYNYLPSGAPVKHENKYANGAVASTDFGLCQINDYYHIGITKDFPSVDYVMQNPEAVVKWMIGMYKDSLLSQWSSYRSGAFKQWLEPNSPMWNLAA